MTFTFNHNQSLLTKNNSYKFSDDVAHIGIAMGTPGDKTNIGKVVKTEPQLQPEQEQQSYSLPATELTFQQSLPGWVINLKIFF